MFIYIIYFAIVLLMLGTCVLSFRLAKHVWRGADYMTKVQLEVALPTGEPKKYSKQLRRSFLESMGMFLGTMILLGGTLFLATNEALNLNFRLITYGGILVLVLVSFVALLIALVSFALPASLILSDPNETKKT